MLASRRHRMRAKLYQSSRAIATLTPSSNQKDFAAREWKRSTAAKPVMRASKLKFQRRRGSSGVEIRGLLVASAASGRFHNLHGVVLCVP